MQHCWIMLGHVVMGLGNNNQQVATYCNRLTKGVHQGMPNNVVICWVKMLRAFGQGLSKYQLLKGGHMYWSSSAECTNAVRFIYLFIYFGYLYSSRYSFVHFYNFTSLIRGFHWTKMKAKFCVSESTLHAMAAVLVAVIIVKRIFLSVNHLL